MRAGDDEGRRVDASGEAEDDEECSERKEENEEVSKVHTPPSR